MLTHIEFDTSREFSVAELQYIQDWSVRSDYRSLGKLITGRTRMTEDEFCALTAGELFGVVLPALGRAIGDIHAITQQVVGAFNQPTPEKPS